MVIAYLITVGYNSFSFF